MDEVRSEVAPMGEGLACLVVSVWLILGYALLEAFDVLHGLRHIAVAPGYVILALYDFLLRYPFDQMTILAMQDGEYGGVVGALFRVVAFAGQVFMIMLPVYLYRKHRTKLYLGLLVVISGLLLVPVCLHLLALMVLATLID